MFCHFVLGYISLREGEKKTFAKCSPLDQGTRCSHHNHIWWNVCVDKWWTRRTTSRAEHCIGCQQDKSKHVNSNRGSAYNKCTSVMYTLHWWECLHCIWRLPSVVNWDFIFCFFICFCRFLFLGCVSICHDMKVLLLSAAGSGLLVLVISSKGIKGIMSFTANTLSM